VLTGKQLPTFRSMVMILSSGSGSPSIVTVHQAIKAYGDSAPVVPLFEDKMKLLFYIPVCCHLVVLCCIIYSMLNYFLDLSRYLTEDSLNLS
jgi:hypothetical protein